MKRIILFLPLIVTISACNISNDPLSVLSDIKWIDLTWSFDENSVYWPTNIPYTHDTVFEGINDKGFYYSSFKFNAEEHGGTHFDAPIHFAEGGLTIEAIPIDRLMGEGILIDVRNKVESNRDYQIQIEDFVAWEEKNGRIPKDRIVLVNTGFAQFYPDLEKYTGTVLKGTEGVANLHFPGLHPDAAEWLANKRNIKAFGLDTPSIDYGQSTEFMTHRILLSKGITAYENLAHLDSLPGKGFWVMALPMKIKGGSGAPLRILAGLIQE